MADGAHTASIEDPAARKRRLLNGFIVACTGVTGFAMFNCFRSLGDQGPMELVSAGLFSILVVAALAFSLHGVIEARQKTERRIWAAGYGACVLVSVMLSFGTYFSLLSSANLASDSASAAVAATLKPLIAFDMAYQDLASASVDLAGYSKELAAEERTSGGTCGAAGPGDGARTRLRTADESMWAAYARHFQERRSRIGVLLATVQKANATAGTTQQAVNQSWAEAASMASDPTFVAWSADLKSRRAAGHGAIVDSVTGASFMCPDGPLDAKLAAAQSVKTPALASAPPTIAKQGLAANVTRGFDILSGKVAWDGHRDTLPLVLAFVVDLLLALFVYAKHGTTAPERDEAGRPAAAKALAGLHAALDRSPEADPLHAKLDRALNTSAFDLVTLIDEQTVLGGGHRYLVVPQGAPGSDRRMRNLVNVLTSTGGAKIHHIVPTEKLSPAWRDQLAERLTGAKTAEVYRLTRDLFPAFVREALNPLCAGQPPADEAANPKKHAPIVGDELAAGGVDAPADEINNGRVIHFGWAR